MCDDGDVGEGLCADEGDGADGEGHALAVWGAEGDGAAAEEDEEVGGGDGGGGDEAEVFGDDGEDEVGVAFGEVVFFLDAAAEADAPDAAVLEGDFGLFGLVVFAFLFVDEACAAVVVGKEECADGEEDDEEGADEAAEAGAAGEEGEAAEAAEDDGAAEVGLDDDEAEEEADDAEGDEEAVFIALGEGADVAEVAGDEDDGTELDEFRGLNVDGAEADPAAGAGDGFADAGDEDEEEGEGHADGEAPEEGLVEVEVVVEAVEEGHHAEADAEEGGLHDDVVIGVVGGFDFADVGEGEDAQEGEPEGEREDGSGAETNHVGAPWGQKRARRGRALSIAGRSYWAAPAGILRVVPGATSVVASSRPLAARRVESVTPHLMATWTRSSPGWTT